MPHLQKLGVSLKCIWRFCLLVATWMPNLETAPSHCELCDPSLKSCSRQFPQYNFGKQDCRMEVFERDGDACSSLEMETQSHGETSGWMFLRSYLFHEEGLYKQTAFNVSFIDFSWKSITYRFMQNGNPKKNSCRRFHFTKQFLEKKPTSLFYDCLWSYIDYEEKTFLFEYVAENDVSTTYSKLIFVVPQKNGIEPGETKLSNWKVFVHVDITNLPNVILKAQTLPEIYNVSLYNVKTLSGRDGDSAVIDEKNVTIKHEEKELSTQFNFGIYPGNYFFTVQPVSEACGESGCLMSRSPDIHIEADFTKLIFAGGVFAIILLLLIFIIVCFKYIHRDKTNSVRPKLLLIYRSTHISHMEVVLELTQHLRINCSIEAKLDELDVNKSETHNPFNWYNDAIAQSDFIAIVSSPTCCNSINGIYPKVDEMALSILQGKGFSRKPLSNVNNLMVLLLPYCSEKTLPQEAKNIGLRFKIPDDINEMVDYIHNFRGKHVFGRLHYCIRSNFIWYMLHQKKSLKKCPALHAAIQEASGEVKKCVGVENRTEPSINVENEKKISKVSYEGFDDSMEEPSKLIKSVSESSLDSEPYHCFPGHIEKFDLLGNESEVAEDEDLKPHNKDDSLLDSLML